MAWLGYALQFLPLVLIISVVCASMKEDRIDRILIKAVRFGATLTALTLVFGIGPLIGLISRRRPRGRTTFPGVAGCTPSSPAG